MNNGKLNMSSFFRVMDKLDEEDENSALKQKPSPQKNENIIKMKKLNLNLLKNNSTNIIMAEKTEKKSLCINDMKKDLIQNIQENSMLF